MNHERILNFIKSVIEHMPEAWLKKTTHRLDIYNESLAKTEFLDKLKSLYEAPDFNSSDLSDLPTAFDYIRLGHPLSCLLEWLIADLNNLKSENVVSFSSKMMPLFAVLRKNLLENKNTQIMYKDKLPDCFDAQTLKEVYGYKFELLKVNSLKEVSSFEGSTVFLSEKESFDAVSFVPHLDFIIMMPSDLGSVALVGKSNESYISEIQHVRRRESIAMTPASSLLVLKSLTENAPLKLKSRTEAHKNTVLKSIDEVTKAGAKALLGSCGLSVQYAITMGLIDEAFQKHSGKKIKIIVPPNCYGGTNDQARRIAACLPQVEVMDLAVDDGHDMAQSVDLILDKVAREDAVPYIIAEIPTNPRVEVPELENLKSALSKRRKTQSGEAAVEPVFILDQTFCPNVHFLGEGEILSTVKTISYVSGSKFPSGGLCTAGYCVANKKAESLMGSIEKHLKICDNEATDLQIEILSEQMPSMNTRISKAYKNTRDFVDYIVETLPGAKINFVSEGLALKSFTPSVFSLDLPTKGETDKEREAYKRELNHKLIRMMIDQIPDESQHCVSYGQLKGCYWTVPATSTQGTTKEGDKDYIVRVAVSPDMNVELHKKVFTDFVKEI